MALATWEIVTALRKTAQKLKDEKSYQWGHMGACNCGNLAQIITNFTKAEIHQYALAAREGDWSEMAEEYCQISGLPLDMMISAMINKGFSLDDFKNLEYLSDKKVLAMIPQEKREQLKHNKKEDVIFYIETWAQLLENELVDKVKLPTLQDVIEVE